MDHLQSALRLAGLPYAAFTGHSFRIGAATIAAQNGIEDSIIQTLGRWKSAAYKLYIRIPPEELVAISRKLV